MVEYATYPSLRGKTVLITGGAEGIGSAAVELFCRQGSNVIFLDYADASAEKVVEKIKVIPGATQPVFMHCDLIQLDELKACAEKTLELYGTVDVLVNNAGGTGSKSRVPTTEVTPETFDHDINVNLRHQFFLTQYVAPAMQKNGSGSIINLGSIMWRIPETTAPVYATAKAAVVGMTRIHSKEYGPSGVRVNSIMPGSIATERQIQEVFNGSEYEAMTMAAQSLKRRILPEDVARLMLFLAADDSSAITGSSYVIDGGWVSDK